MPPNAAVSLCHPRSVIQLRPPSLVASVRTSARPRLCVSLSRCARHGCVAEWLFDSGRTSFVARSRGFKHFRMHNETCPP
eukprot:7014204-Prymnesium_polylepis.1